MYFVISYLRLHPSLISLFFLFAGMSFDLGLDHKSVSDEEEIEEFIKMTEKEFDLVLIAEYFDESLVLMKRMLCWDFEDIIYVKHKIRNPIYKNNITEKQKVYINYIFYLIFSIHSSFVT